MDTDPKIKQALSELLQPGPQEPFVRWVMAAVEALEVPAQPVGWWGRLSVLAGRIPEWSYPELGLAAAALLVFVVTSFQPILVSSELLLLSRLPEVSQPISPLEEAGGLSMEWEVL